MGTSPVCKKQATEAETADNHRVHDPAEQQGHLITIWASKAETCTQKKMPTQRSQSHTSPAVAAKSTKPERAQS
jgi:hypothetical protein